MDKAEKAAAESPDPVTRAVLRQWLYSEKLAAQSGPTGTDLGDIEFAALSGDVGPTVK